MCNPLPLMRSLLLAFVFIFTISAQAASPAASLCEDAFTHAFIEPQNASSEQKTLANLYESAGVLGFANPDHEHQTAFKLLTDFVEQHAADRRLKSVSVELSSELREYLEVASVREPTLQEEAPVAAWIPYLRTQAEPRYIMEHVIPAIRAINATRANDPILIVPIDSVTMKRMVNFDMAFIGSADRENGTAQNFGHQVLERWPTHRHS